MRKGRELRARARTVSARLAMLDRPRLDGPRGSGSRLPIGLAAAAGAVAAVRVAGALDARRKVVWRPGGGDRQDGALGARVLGPNYFHTIGRIYKSTLWGFLSPA
jgi:hypothetical protein